MASICPAVVANRWMYRVVVKWGPAAGPGPIPESVKVPKWLRWEFADISRTMRNSAVDLERVYWPSTVNKGVKKMTSRFNALSTFYANRAHSLWTTSWGGEGWLEIDEPIVDEEIRQDLGVRRARC